MNEDDTEAQADELLALASIYEEGAFTAAEDGSGGQFSAHIQVPQPFFINLDGLMVDQAKRVGVKLHENEDGLCLSVHYLPPIVLNFHYAADYPSCSAPAFTLSCKWLSVYQLSKLCDRLDELWSENSNEVILFLWTQFLLDESLEIVNLTSPITLQTEALARRRQSSFRQTSQESTASSSNKSSTPLDVAKNSTAAVTVGEALNDIKKSSEKESATSPSTSADENEVSFEGQRTCDPRAVQDIASVHHLILTIIEHDQAERQKAFNVAVFSCNVCFSEKQGSDCINFMGCDHVYCKQCMKEYFKVQISEGNVKCLNCPEMDCESQALPSQVRELVGQELYATYDRLLLQMSLEGMEDIVYCPRTACQCPVLMEKESAMGVCPSCKLAFCILCKMTYHGTSPCILRSENLREVLEAWRKGGTEIQLCLEQRYGHEALTKALDDHTNIFVLPLEHLSKIRQQWEEGDPEIRKELEQRYGKKNLIKAVEENFSMEWLKRFSKQCPMCSANIEKIDGCNKMVCYKCRASFCWICRNLVSKSNPYEHFNDPSSQCFNLLFRGVEPDDMVDW